MYRNWVGKGPMDLRGSHLSVYLRGDELQLDGAQCFFWVQSPGCRWHLTSSPLTIADGRWASEPNVFDLRNQESLWHRSWAVEPSTAPVLNDVLGNAHSYGFSFVGFGQEPRGKLSMDEFEIKLT